MKNTRCRFAWARYLHCVGEGVGRGVDAGGRAVPTARQRRRAGGGGSGGKGAAPAMAAAAGKGMGAGFSAGGRPFAPSTAAAALTGTVSSSRSVTVLIQTSQ
jgi:hypothetical protein